MTPPSQADLDLQRRLAALTPEQRRLLELRRRQKEAADPSRPRPLPRRPGRAAAALLRPGAALVPRPPGARLGRLQHPGRRCGSPGDSTCPR